MTTAVPEIEIAHRADAARVGGKHHESYARDAVEHQRMCPELVVELLQVPVAVRDHRGLALIELGQDVGRRQHVRVGAAVGMQIRPFLDLCLDLR